MDNEQFSVLWAIAVKDVLDWQEAAAFESKVAAKLAAWEQELLLPCMETATCRHHPENCPWCRLKYARLAVEEEMDANGK